MSRRGSHGARPHGQRPLRRDLPGSNGRRASAEGEQALQALDAEARLREIPPRQVPERQAALPLSVGSREGAGLRDLPSSAPLPLANATQAPAGVADGAAAMPAAALGPTLDRSSASTGDEPQTAWQGQGRPAGGRPVGNARGALDGSGVPGSDPALPSAPGFVPASPPASSASSAWVSATPVLAHGDAGVDGHGLGPDSGGSGCTRAQMRRFIKSRPWIPLHELRRRFALNGAEDDVAPVDVAGHRIFVGLPPREGQMLGDLLRSGEIGYELSHDPDTPIVIGVYPMRPVTRG